MKKTCVAPNCEKPQKASGLCSPHFNRRSTYRGMTTEAFLRLLEQRACAICGRTDVALHIDHDHKTGKVRDMLCPGCNRALGLLDNQEWVAKAFTYLAQHA